MVAPAPATAVMSATAPALAGVPASVNANVPNARPRPPTRPRPATHPRPRNCPRPAMRPSRRPCPTSASARRSFPGLAPATVVIALAIVTVPAPATAVMALATVMMPAPATTRDHSPPGRCPRGLHLRPKAPATPGAPWSRPPAVSPRPRLHSCAWAVDQVHTRHSSRTPAAATATEAAPAITFVRLRSRPKCVPAIVPVRLRLRLRLRLQPRPRPHLRPLSPPVRRRPSPRL